MKEVLKAQLDKVAAAGERVDELIRSHAVPGIVAGVISLVVLFFGMPVIAGTLMGVSMTLAAQVGLAVAAGVREDRIYDRLEDLAKQTQAAEAEVEAK